MVAAPYHGDPYVSAANDYWRETARARPCPICQHEGWCEVSEDGQWAHCMREGNGAEWSRAGGAPVRNGGWLHALTGAGLPSRPVPVKEPRGGPAAEATDGATQAAIYAQLLSLCPLSDRHRALLTGPGHGLNQEQASRYGTLPEIHEDRRRVISALIERHGIKALLGTPGFFLTANNRVDVAGAGPIFPRRDPHGLITGFQVRRRDPQPGEQKYYILSSSRAPDGGPGPGSACHVARPRDGVIRDARIYVTEGIKKADVMADALGAVVIGVLGVATWRSALPVLAELAGDVMVIAFDSDEKPRTVAHVEACRRHLAAATIEFEYAVRIARWDGAVGKGLDDVLLAGGAWTLERYRPVVTAQDADGGTGIAGIAAAPDADGMILVAPPLLHRLIQESAAAATLRYKYEYVSQASNDPRLKGGQKQLMTALADICGVPTASQPVTEARKVTRAAIARRTGQALSTISLNTPDLDSMGLITLERRPVERQRTIVVPGVPDSSDQREIDVMREEEEWWVSIKPLPDKSINKHQLQELATRRNKAAADKKRCPACGSERLTTNTYRCEACDRTCTADEARVAGQRIHQRDDGVLIDTKTGETMHPGQPMQRLDPYDTPTVAADGAATVGVSTHPLRNLRGGMRTLFEGDNTTPGTGDDTAEMSNDTCPTPPPESEGGNSGDPPLLNSVPLERLGSKGNRIQEEGLEPSVQQPRERCLTCKGTNYRWSERWSEWQCATCYPAPLHIPDSTSTHDGGAL